MTTAMCFSADTEIHYILIPYNMIFKATLKIDIVLLLCQLLTPDLMMFFVLTPVYLMLFYTFYQLFKLLKKFEFKSIWIVLWFAVSNIPTFIFAAFIKFVVFDILL